MSKQAARRVVLRCLVPLLLVALISGGSAPAAPIWSEDFEGEVGAQGLPEGWRGRAPQGGEIAVSSRPEGEGRCLHLRGGEGPPGRVALPAIAVQPGHSYLLRWESRAEGIWGRAGLRIATSGGPRRADGTTLSGTDPWSAHELRVFVAQDEAELRLDLSIDGAGEAWFDDFAVEPYDWPRQRRLPSGVIFGLSYGGSVQLAYNYPNLRVAPDHVLPEEMLTAESVHIECAANEREAFQLMLRPQHDMTGLRATVSELTGPATIPAEAWEVYQVGTVPVPVQKVYHTTAPIEETADPLLPGESFDLRDGRWNCLWIEVKTPRDAPPGIYSGTLSLSGPVEGRIAMEVEVFGFALPERLSLEESAGFRTRLAARGSGLDEGTLRELAIARYRRDGIDWPRLFGIMLGEVEWLRLEDGTPVIDFATFDRVVEAYHALGFRALDIPPTNLRARGRSGARMVPWLGLTPLTDDFDRAFAEYVRAMGEHLRERGWLDDASMYLWDEPQEREYADFLRLAGVVRRAFPELRIKMAGPRFPAEPLYGFVDVWYPNMRWYSLDCYAERIRERQALGEVVGGYGNNRYNLDYPLSFARLWPWTLKLYGLTSHGWWEVAGWSDSPYERSDMPAGPAGGEASNTPGAQYFWYPPATEGGPLVSSLRWEMLRQGREDYEYFTILERLLDERDGQGKGRERVNELIEEAVWGSLDWQYTQDPIVPHRLRRQAAQQIVALGG